MFLRSVCNAMSRLHVAGRSTLDCQFTKSFADVLVWALDGERGRLRALPRVISSLVASDCVWRQCFASGKEMEHFYVCGSGAKSIVQQALREPYITSEVT